MSNFGGFIARYWVVFALIIAFVGLIIWFQVSNKFNGYDILDILKDNVTGKASLDAHVTLFMAMLAAWYVVVKTKNPAAGDLGAVLVQILTVFMVYRVGKQVVQAYAVKPSGPPPAPDQIGQQVVVTPGMVGGSPSVSQAMGPQAMGPPAPTNRPPSAITTTVPS